MIFYKDIGHITDGAADAMLLYNKVINKKEVNGKIIPVKVFSQGLYNRRIKERNLFFTPDGE